MAAAEVEAGVVVVAVRVVEVPLHPAPALGAVVDVQVQVALQVVVLVLSQVAASPRLGWAPSQARARCLCAVTLPPPSRASPGPLASWLDSGVHLQLASGLHPLQDLVWEKWAPRVGEGLWAGLAVSTPSPLVPRGVWVVWGAQVGLVGMPLAEVAVVVAGLAGAWARQEQVVVVAAAAVLLLLVVVPLWVPPPHRRLQPPPGCSQKVAASPQGHPPVPWTAWSCCTRGWPPKPQAPSPWPAD